MLVGPRKPSARLPSSEAGNAGSADAGRRIAMKPRSTAIAISDGSFSWLLAVMRASSRSTTCAAFAAGV